MTQDENKYVRETAIWTLSQLPAAVLTEPVIVRFLAACQHENEEVRKAAIKTLRSVPLSQYFSYLAHSTIEPSEAFCFAFASVLVAKQPLMFWQPSPEPQLHLVTQEETLILPYTEAQFHTWQQLIGTLLSSYLPSFFEALTPSGLMSKVSDDNSVHLPAVAAAEQSSQQPASPAAMQDPVEAELNATLEECTELAKACEQSHDREGALINWQLVLKLHQDLHKPESLQAVTENKIVALQKQLAQAAGVGLLRCILQPQAYLLSLHHNVCLNKQKLRNQKVVV